MGNSLGDQLRHDNQVLRQEVAQLQGQVGTLQGLLQSSMCLSITATRDHLCNGRQSAGGEGEAMQISTAGFAQLRPPGYRRQHEKWRAAKDHWASQYVKIGAEQRRIGFKINTHNPDTEDIFISRAAHRKQIWDKPVFNVFKHVLVSSGLPSGRVLDVGGNIGYFTLWALAMGHKVTTFEPMDFNVRYIVTSIDANPGFGANHTLYQNAVGNAAGRLALTPTNAQNRGNYQVHEPPARTPNPETPTPRNYPMQAPRRDTRNPRS